jgi:hypothetical protein
MRVPAAQLRSLRRGDAPAAPVESGNGAPAELGERREWRSTPVWPWILVCLAVAALTLVFPSTPTYDPWAWILWGREIVDLDLVTTGGPSWKPLPMFFTVPFALLGDDVAPYLWLVVARAGGLLACVMAYRVANRLMGGGWYGALAGVGAFLALFSSFKFVRDAALGNSEALLAALALWAFERHLDGRRDHALYLGVAAALLRPEVWPFLGIYGLWLWFSEPRLRLRMVGLAALIPALWFLPEWWGAGDPFRAGARANQPNPGSPAYAEHPFLDIASRFRKVVIAPVKAGVIIAGAWAAYQWLKHRRQGATVALAAGGVAWFLLVAGMTEAGFAGNQRYLIVSTAAACVLGGMGAALVLRGFELLVRRISGSVRAGAIAAAATFVIALGVSAPFIEEKADNTGRVSGGLEHEAELWDDLRALIDEAGGSKALISCGGIFSGPFQIQMLAYELDVHGIDIGWRETPPPGVAFRTRTVPDGPLVVKPTDDRFRVVASHGKYRVLTVPPSNADTDCPAASRFAPRAPLPRDFKRASDAL